MARLELTETAASAIQAPPASQFSKAYLSRDWTIKVSALALAGGTLLTGAAFGLKNGVLGQPKAPSFVASADGSSRGPLPNGQTVTTSSDAGMTSPKDITQPIEVKDIIPDQPPIDDRTSLGKPQSSGTLSAMAINVAPLFAAPAPATPEFPNSNALPGAPLGTSGTQIATAAPPATDAGHTVHATDEAQRPAASVRIGAGAAAGPGKLNKVGLPSKLSGKPPGRLSVAKTETAAPEPQPEKPPPGAAGPLAATEGPPPAPPPVKPLSNAFSHVVGAIRAPPAATPEPVDQIVAQNSSDWALQFAMRKSEAEANANAVHLNAKYAAALKGAKIGVNKVIVNGQTSYAPRVSGLSKADVAALCQRLKGRDCLIAK
jgi:hypothetical protein